MTDPTSPGIPGELPPASTTADSGAAGRTGERRLPFTLRVAAVWMVIGDSTPLEDGAERYWRSAPLTGNVVSTSSGRDVSFSDLEVR